MQAATMRRLLAGARPPCASPALTPRRSAWARVWRIPAIEEEERMERDPVCGMPVDPEQSAHASEHEGQTYYFCSERCKRQFDQDPSLYIDLEAGRS
jgi:Cu+-exporting ATPase